MARKKSSPGKTVEGLTAEMILKPITRTIEENFMPYAMSVIVSRAIPEIDGFKPSHRKLLYTMYKMGLLTGARTKSANVVGQTMRLNPHGEGAIYETMVRLARGSESLLHPFVDSKGNFGKVYSRDMAYAASRYTEVRLDAICGEIFRDIDRDTVDFSDNYDNTTQEPTLLPTTFPNILVSANQGIAVGMASQICGFNLAEVCRTTVALLNNPDCDLLETMPAPDFSTGGELLYSRDDMASIYETGRGSFKVRSRWRHDKAAGVIEVYEIPYTTTIEAIVDGVTKLVKDGKLKEVSDIRDETDLNGLKIAIDIKRGVEPEKLMQRLFRMTSLQESFSCNFNVLVAGSPRVMGVRELLTEWQAWRLECVRRRLHFDAGKLREKLHLLLGLQKILLDIDKAIKIIRETEEEAEVVPNLMIGFRIDKIQAEYIADIRLRNINKEFILKRLAEVDSLKAELEELEKTLADRSRITALIIRDLEAVEKKYGAPRRTTLIYDHQEYQPEEHIEDYPVNCFVSREGYFKKITPASLRMSGEHRFKDGDALFQAFDGTNKEEILFFTNRRQCYKVRLHEFEDTKASALGDYLPSKLGMEDGENVVFTCLPGDFSGNLLFCFESGKVARVELAGYATVTNRRKLTGAYGDKSPLAAAMHLAGELELALFSSDGRALLFHTSQLAPKTTRSTQGVAVMAVKPRHKIVRMELAGACGIVNASRYRVRSLPGAGLPLKPEDRGEEQLEIE